MSGPGAVELTATSIASAVSAVLRLYSLYKEFFVMSFPETNFYSAQPVIVFINHKLVSYSSFPGFSGLFSSLLSFFVLFVSLSLFFSHVYIFYNFFSHTPLFLKPNSLSF